MKLYLVQHGEATTKDVNPDRPLTKKGKSDSSKTASFLKASGINVDLIWHSTKKRAIETAKIFERELSPKETTQEKENLSPNDPVSETFEMIGKAKKDIMIVGHLPFLQKLLSLMLLDSESYEILKFNMGGCVCLECGEEGKWQLLFGIIPDLLK